MSTNALSIQEQKGMLAVSSVKQQQEAIWKLMKEVMEDGKDYGIQPGAKKPSLYKPGSEKILSMFQLAVDVLVEEVIPPAGAYDEYRVRVYVTVKEMHSQRFIGKGTGECSSFEEKYKWRAASGPLEFQYFSGLGPDMVRVKFKQEWSNGRPTGKELQENQVRVPTADRMNTVLKIGKKRAQIDVVLTATAASAIFTQDLEDVPDYLRDAVEENQEQGRPQNTPPKRKSETQKNGTSQNGGEQAQQDPLLITERQQKMLYAVSRSCKLSEDEVKAKLKAEFKDKNGNPLEHSKDMLKADFQKFLDDIDPKFEHHMKPKTQE